MLSDFGDSSPFVGITKGVILKINPEAIIIDLTHKIKPQDVWEGFFVIRISFSYFPKGSIFLAVVDPGVGKEDRKAILVETENFFFIGPDNGLLSGVLEKEKIKGIYNLNKEKYFHHPVSRTFHARDIFAPVAGYLSKGISPIRLGEKINDMVRLKFPLIKKEENGNIIGEVVYIDTFGNLITNITEEIIKDRGERFSLIIKEREINNFVPTYALASKEDIVTLINSFGLLEIAQNCGLAQKSLEARVGDKVILKERRRI